MITYITQQSKYEDFLQNGGCFKFQLDKDDIDKVNDFENYDHIKKELSQYGCFKIPLSSQTQNPITRHHIILHGDTWNKIQMAIHERGGEIIYKKSNNHCLAECSIPRK